MLVILKVDVNRLQYLQDHRICTQDAKLIYYKAKWRPLRCNLSPVWMIVEPQITQHWIREQTN